MKGMRKQLVLTVLCAFQWNRAIQTMLYSEGFKIIQILSFLNWILKTAYYRKYDIRHIEITSWLVSAYDFYSRVVKNR